MKKVLVTIQNSQGKGITKEGWFQRDGKIVSWILDSEFKKSFEEDDFFERRIEEKSKTSNKDFSCQNTKGHKHEWIVYSTAVGYGVIMVKCDCGRTGSIHNPSIDEWKAAYYAPSNPYLWTGDNSRIHINKKRNKG